jgi:hypothetical protein
MIFSIRKIKNYQKQKKIIIERREERRMNDGKTKSFNL